MFVGESGLGRVIQRSCEVMSELGTDDPARVRAHGALDLPTIQKYLNFWFSSALDLFGAEVSTNAASYFAAGLKGRPDEESYDDHDCSGATFALERPRENGGGVATEEIPMRNAMNAITRGAYVRDCGIGLKRWNRAIAKAGIEFELKLPSERFRRGIGVWAGQHIAPDGTPMAEDAWQARLYDWIPSQEDRGFVQSLMRQVVEPGKIAGWIAPPPRGVNNLPVDYEYVRL